MPKPRELTVFVEVRDKHDRVVGRKLFALTTDYSSFTILKGDQFAKPDAVGVVPLLVEEDQP